MVAFASAAMHTGHGKLRCSCEAPHDLYKCLDTIHTQEICAVEYCGSQLFKQKFLYKEFKRH